MSEDSVFEKRINKIIRDNNYTELVRKDWQQSDKGYVIGLQKILGIKGNNEDINNKYVKYIGEPDKVVITEILKDFPVKVIDDVCDNIKSVDLEKLWSNSSYFSRTMKEASKSINVLNKFRKSIGSIVLKYGNSENFPFIVNEPLKESYALATAYRDFLADEVKKTKYKSDGTEYDSLTRRIEWHTIITNIYRILFNHIVDSQERYKRKLLHGEGIMIVRLITRLLAAEYPWCWGEEQEPNAEKIVKDRIDRMPTQ